MKSILKFVIVLLSIFMVQGTLAAETFAERDGKSLTCYGGKTPCGTTCVSLDSSHLR